MRNAHKSVIGVHMVGDMCSCSGGSRPCSCTIRSIDLRVAAPSGQSPVQLDGKIFKRIGLGDQIDTGIDYAVMYNGVARVAGGEQYSQLRFER
jgi:hypothetical protein